MDGLVAFTNHPKGYIVNEKVKCAKMDCKGDDFDKFESFVKSTLSGTVGHFIKSKHKVINDDTDDEIVAITGNSDNLYKQINTDREGIVIVNLDHVNDSSSSSSSHGSSLSSGNTSTNTISRLSKRPIASPAGLAENFATENIIIDLPLNNPTTRASSNPSHSMPALSASTDSIDNSIDKVDNICSKRTKLSSSVNNTENTIVGTSDEIIIIDEELTNSDTGSDVMVVGAKIPSIRQPFGSLPVERFLNDYFPQWYNPKDDLVIGPSLVHPKNSQNLHFQKLSKKIPKNAAPPTTADDDCVPLTPSETQECLWREKFLDTLEYFLKCPICYRTVHRIGQVDSYHGSKSFTHTSRLMYSTKCGHIFCNKCIDYVRKKKQCAICRKPIRDKNQYHPLYL